MRWQFERCFAINGVSGRRMHRIISSWLTPSSFSEAGSDLRHRHGKFRERRLTQLDGLESKVVDLSYRLETSCHRTLCVTAAVKPIESDNSAPPAAAAYCSVFEDFSRIGGVAVHAYKVVQAGRHRGC